MTLVGALPKPLRALLVGNRSVSGSNIGGIPQTQEMRALGELTLHPAFHDGQKFETEKRSGCNWRTHFEGIELRASELASNN